MKTKLTLTADVLQVLDWYEVPELVLLAAPKQEYVLAVRSANMESPANTYVGGSMTARRLRDYANGKCDLRYAISHANLRRFWTFSLEPNQDTVTLHHIRRSSPELQCSLPAPGLFSTEHEDIDLVKSFVPNTIEKFGIDGSWDLGEFSQFYGQLEDIYYLSADIERFDDPTIGVDERSVIEEAFDRSWDGGGSYVAFYKNVANDNDFHAPLRVSGIQYNSPGHVKVHAQSEYFANLMSMLEYYRDHKAEAKKAFFALGSFMSASKMKRKGFRQSNLTRSQLEGLELRAIALASHIPGVSFDTLKSMTGGNSLIAAKVPESVFRRIRRLFKYFEEGRVQYDGLSTR